MVFKRTSPESPRFRASKSTPTKTVFIVDFSVFQKYFKSTNDRFMRSTERTEQHSFRARSIPPKISNHLHHNLIKHIMSLPDSNKLINEVQLPILFSQIILSIYIDIEIKTVFDLSMLITQKFSQNLDCEVFLRMLESKSPARDQEFKVLSLLLIHHFLNLLYFYLFLAYRIELSSNTNSFIRRANSGFSLKKVSLLSR